VNGRYQLNRRKAIMKVKVTHLKAPWPEGTKPGDIVDIVDRKEIPGWALGKCTPLPDGTEAQHVWQPPAPPVEPMD
jgi:hypothetical protein